MYKRALLLLLPMLVINYSLLSGEVRFVSKTGSSTPPYTSWATAADSIQKCINFSQSGDTIYVGNGIYKEQIVISPGIALIGSGMDDCIIDTKALAQPQDFVAVFVRQNSSIEGFHITVSTGNDGTWWGTGIWIWHTAGLTMQGYAKNNKITKAKYGIGLKDVTGNAAINNIITNSQEGIEISNWFDSNPIIDGNIISNLNCPGCTSGDYGIRRAWDGAPTIKNNLIISDKLTKAIDGYTSDSLFIYNNLLIINNARGELISLVSVKTLCFNNVIYGSGNWEGIWCIANNVVMNNSVEYGEKGINQTLGTAGWPVVKYNNSSGYTGRIPDSTNLSVDPMYVDGDNRDFHLQMFSPLIDAGAPEILDLDGTRSDIGLYGGPLGGTYNYIDYAPKPPRNVNAGFQQPKITLTWDKNTEADFSHYKIYRDTTANFSIDTSRWIGNTEGCIFKDEMITTTANIYYKLTAVDNQGNESGGSEEVVIVLVGVKEPKIMVKDFILYQNYPNPFNPSTKIGYEIKKAGMVKINVYDIKGEKIRELVNEYKSPGYYEVDFEDASAREGLTSGIYLYKMDVFENGTPLFSEIKKMVKIK